MDLAQRSHHPLIEYSQIIEKARAALEAAPAFIRYDAHGQNEDAESYASSFPSLHMYLDYLYTIFLLQRVLLKRTNTGQDALIHTSREALSIVIRIVSKCEASMDLNRHYSWLVCFYHPPHRILSWVLTSCLRYCTTECPAPVS